MASNPLDHIEEGLDVREDGLFCWCEAEVQQVLEKSVLAPRTDRSGGWLPL